MRLFPERLEPSDDERDAIGSLFFSRCDNAACTHPPGCWSSFEWAFPIVIEPLFRDETSRAGLAARFLSYAVMDCAVEPLKRILPFVGDLTADRKVGYERWLPLADPLMANLIDDYEGWEDCARLLIPLGLDLHASTNDMEWSTPTSMALSYYFAFLRFQRLLRELRIDIPAFVEEELKQKACRDQGWTRESLQELLEFEFASPRIPERCSRCDYIYRNWECGGRQTWLDMLERLRKRRDADMSVAKNLERRDAYINDFKEPLHGICYNFLCAIGKLNAKEKEAAKEEDDSPFLLSI
jgi:hypothetical protein